MIYRCRGLKSIETFRGALPMNAMATEREVAAAPVECPSVVGKLEATRQEFARFGFWLMLARLLLAEIILGSALMLADWMWVLPVSVRALGLVAMLGLAAWIVWRARRSIGRAAVAAKVEGQFPELGQRVRTVIQYAEPAPDTVPASPSLVRALARDTEERTTGLEFRKLVPWLSFERRAVALFCAAAVAIVTLVVSPGLRTALLRMLLLPLHYTGLTVEPGNTTLKAGEALEIKIVLSGRPVRSASWSYRKQGDAGHWTTISLTADAEAARSESDGEGEGAGHVTTTSLTTTRSPEGAAKPLLGALNARLKDCQADLDYRVVAGEVESPVFHVKVVHPLLLRGIEATVTPPPYTRRPIEVVKDGNFRAIAGSQIALAVTLDRAPSTAALYWRRPGHGESQSIPLKIDGPRLTAELPTFMVPREGEDPAEPNSKAARREARPRGGGQPVREGEAPAEPNSKAARREPRPPGGGQPDLEYEIVAADYGGMELEKASYRIKFIVDEKPTIHFIEPDESLAVTPITEVPIQVEATDDFGLARLGIVYKIGDGPEETLHLASLEKQPLTANELTTLYLEKHPLSITDAITYHAFVEDNYPEKPHRVVSDLRYIDILPYKQEYKLVEGQEGSSPGERSLTLEELIARQRVNLNRTFFQEKDRSQGEAAIMRLATFEEELATATAEFSEGLKAIGLGIEALDVAAGAMRSATQSLDAKDLATARPQEEAALKALVSARRNVQKLLSQSNSTQMAACRQFDRQQVQKIRRPRQDDKLAELEADLLELAKREQDFSEEIDAKGGGGPEFDRPPPSVPRTETPEDPPEEPKNDPAQAAAKNSNSASKPRTDPVEAQKKAAEEADRLRRLAQRDPELSDLAKSRLDAAAKMVEDAYRAMQEGRKADAALEARDAARKLESAARQVGALKGKELTDRLARQRDLAQAIAKAERDLARALEESARARDVRGRDTQSLAHKQNELADEVAALADVLARLKMAAAEEEPELALSIGRAVKTNPPEEVEDVMRKNAGEIGAGHALPASQTAIQAAGRLEALAQDLESARRSAIQPHLDRLLAAEKQAAEVQDRLRSVKQPYEQAAAAKSLADVARLIDGLAPGAGPLRQAADRLTLAAQSGHAGWVTNHTIQRGENGYFTPPAESTGGLSAVILALQAKIQEMVLDNALVERTGPVPPQYKSLVEDYYRVLSQDLR
jgi:hypothetical protein